MTYEGVQYERQSKNSSTCQRLLYSAAIVSADQLLALSQRMQNRTPRSHSKATSQAAG